MPLLRLLLCTRPRKVQHSMMASDSKYLSRCKTHWRRDSNLRCRSSNSEEKKWMRQGDSLVRECNKRCSSIRCEREHRDIIQGMNRNANEIRLQTSKSRLSSYDKYRDDDFKKEKIKRHRDHCSPSSSIYYSKTYESRRERENRRHVSRSKRNGYDDRTIRQYYLPEFRNTENGLMFSPHVRGPPLRVPVAPPPTRILLPPRIVPHMRPPFPRRVLRPGVRPILLAPVVVLRPVPQEIASVRPGI